MTQPTAFQIVIIEPPGYQHSGAFIEIAETLAYGFRALGFPARAIINNFAPGAVNVVLGPHLLPPGLIDQLPANTIIYNLEQVEESLFDWAPILDTLFTRFEVWDYSERNIAHLRARHPDARLFALPIGWAPEMARIKPAPEEYDVLFYGAVNDRRRAVLKAIADSGLTLKAVFGAYGAARDAMIARSKLVLNLHKHDAQVFEIVRVSYLLGNGKAVVTEISPTTEIDPDLRDAVAGTPYDGLVERCRALVDDDAARAALGERGRHCMAARPQSAFIQTLLERRKAV